MARSPPDAAPREYRICTAASFHTYKEQERNVDTYFVYITHELITIDHDPIPNIIEIIHRIFVLYISNQQRYRSW